MTLALATADAAEPSTGVLSGALIDASCDDAGGTLATAYDLPIACDPTAPATCGGQLAGLRPGRWVHRIAISDGEAAGRQQARQALLLDASAGTQDVTWPLYRSVYTVGSLVDALDCVDCLRAALARRQHRGQADAGAVRPRPERIGDAGRRAPATRRERQITLDGFDANGMPHTRTIDAAGLNNAALRITGSDNRIQGLRIANSGGDSDALLIDGPEANGNLIDDVAVAGRAMQPCQVGEVIGCVLNGVCVIPSPGVPRGACGDDGIAVRNFAGAVTPNIVRHADVRGAHDKGIKASYNGVVRVESSLVTGNTDGGIQATLSGQVTAVGNEVLSNRGTQSAPAASPPTAPAPVRLRRRASRHAATW